MPSQNEVHVLRSRCAQLAFAIRPAGTLTLLLTRGFKEDFRKLIVFRSFPSPQIVSFKLSSLDRATKPRPPEICGCPPTQEAPVRASNGLWVSGDMCWDQSRSGRDSV